MPEPGFILGQALGNILNRMIARGTGQSEDIERSQGIKEALAAGADPGLILGDNPEGQANRQALAESRRLPIGRGFGELVKVFGGDENTPIVGSAAAPAKAGPAVVTPEGKARSPRLETIQALRGAGGDLSQLSPEQVDTLRDPQFRKVVGALFPEMDEDELGLTLAVQQELRAARESGKNISTEEAIKRAQGRRVDTARAKRTPRDQKVAEVNLEEATRNVKRIQREIDTLQRRADRVLPSQARAIEARIDKLREDLKNAEEFEDLAFEQMRQSLSPEEREQESKPAKRGPKKVGRFTVEVVGE